MSEKKTMAVVMKTVKNIATTIMITTMTTTMTMMITKKMMMATMAMAMTMMTTITTSAPTALIIHPSEKKMRKLLIVLFKYDLKYLDLFKPQVKFTYTYNTD